MMNSESVLKSKNVIIAILCIMIFFIGIGYAVVASKLVIYANVKTSGMFKVGITNVVVKEKFGEVTNNNPIFTNDVAVISTMLKKPRDSVTYTITVHNFGTVDAVLQNVSVTNPSNDYIEITNNIDSSIELLIGQDITFDVNVYFKDINTNYIPQDVSLNTIIVPEYIQKS